MKKTLTLASALICAAALTLTSCAEAPGTGGASAPPAESPSAPAPVVPAFKACMVSDSGGFDDKSFNQTSHKGLLDAKAELGIETGQVESQHSGRLSRRTFSRWWMRTATSSSLSGFLLSDDTLAAAKKNPDTEFAIVDNNDPKTYPAVTNLKPLVFNTAQSSFLAGYLAAGMTKTKKLGTFGGAKIPTVTIFMDGFSQGVDYYNKQKSTDVQVLGWDAAKQDGQFTGDFEDIKGRPAYGAGLDQPGC